jgi:hypothetical protein
MNAESPHARQIILAGPKVNKIDVDIVEKLKRGNNIEEAIVWFKEKTYGVLDDLKKMKFDTRELKRAAVKAALMAHSEKCHKNVIKLLQSNSIEFESFFLEPAVLIKCVPPEIVMSIAELDEVETIEPNFEIKINLCTKSKSPPAEKTSVSDLPPM